MKRATFHLIIALALTACGGGVTPSGSAPGGDDGSPGDGAPPPAGATELTFWTFVDRHGTWFEQRADEWNEEFPDRPITVSTSVVEYEQMHNNLLAALTSGTGAPDIVDIEIGKFANFARGEISLLDLSAEVEPYTADLVATRLAPYQVDGKQYGVDYHLGAVLAFYNTEVLDAAGVNPDDIRTWDDYIEAGLEVTEDTDGDGTPDVWMAAIDVNGPIPVRSLMLQAGGGVYNEDGDLILDTPENAEALQLVSDMVHTHGIATGSPGGNNGTPEFFQAMVDGQFASVWMPQWYMTRFPDNMESLCGKMVVRPMPLFEEDGFTTTMQGGTGTAVTDQTPEDEQQLAKDFVAWAKLTKEGQTSIWNDLGFDPYREDVYDDPALQEEDECFSNEITFEIINSELGNVAPEYTGPAYPQVQDYLNNTLIYDVVQSGVAPADALAAAQEAMEAAAP